MTDDRVARPPAAPRRLTRIERVPASRINQELPAWKQARADGWDVVVLLAPSGGDVLVLACWDPQMRTMRATA